MRLSRFSVAIAVSGLSGLAACVTTGATLNSGVGDRMLQAPPYVAEGKANRRLPIAARVGFLPVMYQPGATSAPLFDPAAGDTVNTLLSAMTAYLDSLAIGPRLAEGGRVAAVTHEITSGGPDVQFGCVTENLRPDGDCVRPGDEGDAARAQRGAPRLRLAVTRPTTAWSAWMRELMHANAVDVAVVLTLEVGQYPVRADGWRGAKSVTLGTGYTQSLPWITSLDAPVSTLQVTGALVNGEGEVVRIAAEGLLARQTNILLSGIGAQRLITARDVDAVHRTRREDLPGAPVVWQVALRQLLKQLADQRVPGALSVRE
jgi:hypothetical protein